MRFVILNFQSNFNVTLLNVKTCLDRKICGDQNFSQSAATIEYY